jgi:hypothetical protein
MDNRDWWMLYGLIAGLSLCSILHSRVISKMIDDMRDLRADVNWLKDNTIAHETEARP